MLQWSWFLERGLCRAIQKQCSIFVLFHLTERTHFFLLFALYALHSSLYVAFTISFLQVIVTAVGPTEYKRANGLTCYAFDIDFYDRALFLDYVFVWQLRSATV